MAKGKKSKKKLVDLGNPAQEIPKLVDVKLPRGHHKLDLPHFREEKPSISLKYIDLKFRSFGDLKDGRKLKDWDIFLVELGNSPDWSYVFKHFQRAPSDTPKARKMMQSMNLCQTDMFHIRVKDEFRIHGFRIDGRFKLIWLDPYHEINKM